MRLNLITFTFGLLLTLPVNCLGQSVVIIKLDDTKLKEFQAITMGDTIIGTYDSSPNRLKVGQINYLILAESSTNFESEAFKSKILMAGKNTGDSLHIYSLDEYKNTYVHTFYKSGGGLRFSRTAKIKLTGKFLANFVDNNVRIITTDKKSSSIIVSEMMGSGVGKVTRFELLPALFDKVIGSSGASFIAHDNPSPVEVLGETKLYYRNSTLYITIDERLKYEAMTTHLKLDMISGKVTNSYLKDEDVGRYRTYIYGDKIFKFWAAGHKIGIRVFDLTTSKLAGQVTIDKRSEIAQKGAWLINGPAERTELGEPIANYLKHFYNLFIIPETREGEETIYLRLGHVSLDVKTTPALHGFGMLGLVTQMVSLGRTLATMDNIGEIYYFYLKYENGAFEFVPSVPGSLNQLVEDYEMKLPPILKYAVHAYLRTPDTIYGCYLVKKTDDFRIVRFSKPKPLD